MWKNRKRRGFTLAEMLIVVAIIGILGGVAAVNVASHFRSMTKLEYDNYARSIFIAAQNHLTMAEHEGYLGRTYFGTLESENTDIYYYVVEDGAVRNDGEKSAFGLILPDNAIDGMIRSNSYIIRYQKDSARVLDVFYWSTGGGGMFNRATRFAHHYSNGDYESFMSKRDDKSALETYSSDGSVIGYYGGVEAQSQKGEKIEDPIIELKNEEVLHVVIKDPNINNNKAVLELIIEGNTSGAIKHIAVSDKRVKQNNNDVIDGITYKVYDVTLDDITLSDYHFANLEADTGSAAFLPGEDITVYAVSSSTEHSNVGYSAKQTTNSLYGDNTIVTPKIISDQIKQASVSAAIRNFRHLENISYEISNIDIRTNSTEDTVYLTDAKQMQDLDWHSFTKYDSFSSPIIIYPYSTSAERSNYYIPVNPGHAVVYNGQKNKISNVEINYSGNVGVFGTLMGGTVISNMDLINFSVTGTNKNEGGFAVANAGALVGLATETTITNVVAHNTIVDNVVTISSSGNTGGLIGSATDCEVSKCAAALVVGSKTIGENSTITPTNAGGLIGSTSGGKVEASYSGGHTYSGAPSGTHNIKNSVKDIYPVRYYNAAGTAIYNVTGGTTAGGLIGSAGTTEITSCYSTCSATGGTAGGFVGTSSGEITNCYCTGLVMKPTDSVSNRGAFAGALTGTAKNCQYFEIINEIKRDDNNNEITDYNYLRPLGNVTREDTDTAPNLDITPFDETAPRYDDFCGAPSSWKLAEPYDAGSTDEDGLKKYYAVSGKTCYNLRTVAQLGASVSSSDFVATHYGDWPAPEEFIFN